MNSLLAKFLQYLRPLMLVAAVVLLLLLVVRLGEDKVLTLVGTMSVGWIAATVLTILLNFLFAARRYQMLVATTLPFLRVFEAIMLSFLLNYASMVQGLGIGAKVGMLKADGVQASRSIAGIFSEIAFDLLFAIAVGVVFWLAANDPGEVLNGIPPQFAQVFFGVIAVGVVAGAVALRYSKFLQSVLTELFQIAKSGKLFGMLLTTAGIWIVAGMGFYCMLNSLEAGKQAELFLCIVAITTGFITGLVSMVPGGIGVREVTWAWIVSLSGISLEVAALVALLYRALSILVIVLVLLLWRQLTRLRGERAA